MDACEHLLRDVATLEELTARRIAIAAHATPSAISYHFGSQEALIIAVAERVYRRLNAERLSLLRQGDRAQSAQCCLILTRSSPLMSVPSIRWSLDPTSSYPVLSHVTSLAQRHRDVEHYRRIIDNVEHHRAFIPPLKRIAPWLDDVDIGWRLNCALGIRSQVTRSRSRTEILTNHAIDLDNPDIVIARMVEVIAPMFRRQN